MLIATHKREAAKRSRACVAILTNARVYHIPGDRFFDCPDKMWLKMSYDGTLEIRRRKESIVLLTFLISRDLNK